MILFVIIVLFMALSFIAGGFFTLWYTSEEHDRAVQDRKWARKYNIKD